MKEEKDMHGHHHHHLPHIAPGDTAFVVLAGGFLILVFQLILTYILP
ncbi:MAG: hypothetical protein JXR37_35650 [Kiritimatiellae bacterium]|nr:hypothetical protein [Kiritimatiellia bacterium]